MMTPEQRTTVKRIAAFIGFWLFALLSGFAAFHRSTTWWGYPVAWTAAITSGGLFVISLGDTKETTDKENKDGNERT